MIRTLLVCLLVCASPELYAGGTVEGTLSLDSMKPAPRRPGYVAPLTKKPVEKPEFAPAIVYLEHVDKHLAYPRARAGEVVRIRQEGYQFRPPMLAVQTGARVIFPNMDDEFHNVLSYSKPNDFDLGRFRKDDEQPGRIFDKAGVVRIYCEIHQHMRCFLLVLDTPWFVTTDASGRFTLKDIPAGDYWLRVFQPSEKRLQQRVTVTEGKPTVVNLAR